MSRMQELYKSEVIDKLMKQFNYASVMEVPRITKITLNMGVGEAIADKKVMQHAVNDMTAISGQKPIVTNPRIRDFRGLKSRSFDGRGNYSMGLKEQIVFPEINYDKIDALRGLDITITTTAKTDDEARALLKAFNFPIKE